MKNRVYILGIAAAAAIMLISTFAFQGFRLTTAFSSSYQQLSSEDTYRAEIDSAILKIGNLSASISQTNKDLTQLKIGVSEAVKQMQGASLQSEGIRSQIYSISDVPEKYKDSHTRLLLSMEAMQNSVESSLASLEHLEAAGISHGQLTLWLLNAPESTYLGTMQLMHKDELGKSYVDAARASFRDAQSYSQTMVEDFDLFIEMSNGDFGTMNHKFFLNAVSELAVDESCWC